MSEELKTIKEWEIETGAYVTDKYKLSKKVSRDDFKAIIRDITAEGNGRSVDLSIRVPFLEKNGYKVTRKNLLDVTLPSKQEILERSQDGQE